jgi:hypothetical protein
MTEIERIADLIATRIFYHNNDSRMREQLRLLLIDFADQVIRSAIEP